MRPRQPPLQGERPLQSEQTVKRQANKGPRPLTFTKPPISCTPGLFRRSVDRLHPSTTGLAHQSPAAPTPEQSRACQLNTGRWTLNGLASLPRHRLTPTLPSTSPLTPGAPLARPSIRSALSWQLARAGLAHSHRRIPVFSQYRTPPPLAFVTVWAETVGCQHRIPRVNQPPPTTALAPSRNHGSGARKVTTTWTHRIDPLADLAGSLLPIARNSNTRPHLSFRSLVDTRIHHRAQSELDRPRSQSHPN